MSRLDGTPLPAPSPLAPPKRSPRPCPRCKYDVRGVVGGVCPECGLELTRSRVEFQTAHWNVPQFYIGAIAIVAAFIPALLAGAVILTAAGFTFSRADGADRFNLVVLITWIAGLGKLGVSWINWSGTMAAWPRVKHWLVALACWLLPAGGVGVAFLMGTIN